MWEEKLVIYDKLIAEHPTIKRKGKTMPYTSANGYMYSFLNKAGEIGVRLPKASCLEFMDTYKTTIFKSHGAVMKDYVLVPDSVLNDSKLFLSYLDKSYNHVMSLKPK